jgi:hypothetical protein
MENNVELFYFCVSKYVPPEDDILDVGTVMNLNQFQELVF